MQSGCFHNTSAHRGCRLRRADHMVLIPSLLICSLVPYFGFLISPFPPGGCYIFLCSVQLKFPPVLCVSALYLGNGPLSRRPAFFSFSIVFRSLRSLLSNNRLFMHCLSLSIAPNVPHSCVFVRVCRNK